VTVTIFLMVMPGAAQDLPDPGRRLTKEELEGKPRVAPPPKPGPRDPQACERARTYYQVMCGVPESRRSHSRDCAEAYALYRQSC
jgi:hypothetical protein